MIHSKTSPHKKSCSSWLKAQHGVQADVQQWRHVPNLATLQDLVCEATTGSALVTVLEEGADHLPHLSSQYLALACQRLAHFEAEQAFGGIDGLQSATRWLQVGATLVVSRWLCDPFCLGTGRLPCTQVAAASSLPSFVPAHLAAMLGSLAELEVQGPATDDLVARAAEFSRAGVQRFDTSHHVTLIRAFADLTPAGQQAAPEVRSAPAPAPHPVRTQLFDVCRDNCAAGSELYARRRVSSAFPNRQRPWFCPRRSTKQRLSRDQVRLLQSSLL